MMMKMYKDSSYFTVKCLECGKLYKQLTQHLRCKHNMSVEEYRKKYGEDTPVWSQECLDKPSPMKGKKHPSKEKIIKNLKSFKGEHKGKNIGVSGLPVYSLGIGYLGVWVEGKNMYEHVYIMQQHLGRELQNTETVHHVDGNKKNNTLNNLKLMDKTEHASFHMTMKRRDETINSSMFKGKCNNPYGRKGKLNNMATKKINSSKKGSEYELKIAKTLSKWWGETFHRTPMSGGLHWKEDNRVAGDIVTPPDSIFPFSVECKKRESWKDMDSLIKGTNSELEEYWEQCISDAESIGLKPMLIFAKNFNPDFVMIALKDYPKHIDLPDQCFVLYKLGRKPDRIIVKLDAFLEKVSKEDIIEHMDI